MKTRISVLLFALVQVGLAHADGPSSELCNQPKKLASVEKAIVKDVRNSIDTYEAGAGAFSFHFTPVWHNKDVSDMTVYFEKVSADGKVRRGYTSQYNVNAKTCIPTFVKMQALFTDQENTSGLETASPVPEACNSAAELPAVHAAIIAAMDNLTSQIMPGSKSSNYMFSGVWRVAGAGDMTAVFEVNQPGLITTPMIGQFSVDPKTCAPSVKVVTAFTRLLTTY